MARHTVSAYTIRVKFTFMVQDTEILVAPCANVMMHRTLV